ncbi:tubulin-specific chaperone E isoform X2 [Anoplophora glabripennis]|nr:tubulin-specific chaperone E isoform X2 [Anoplophora glabripennis]XP_018566592.1 tubulin-specific chaperone E isoform X2 [Anoplophora glabripennis]
MVAESAIPDHNVGGRIECCGHFGTIKYIGPVEGHPGVWLGIDWDDIERGKHNGTVNGIHYFNTRHPKSGSFLRREKVNFGQSLITAIRMRYGERGDELTAKIEEQQLLNFQQSINAPFLELVGFDKIVDKQSDFNSLEVVNVRLQHVNNIGTPYELNCLCPNIREIDISKNLLSSWTDVFDICSQLKHLFWINVSENILSIPENYKEYIFPNITVLICGYMTLTWEDIIKLSSVFPNIEELRVPYNNITSLTIPNDRNLKRLRVLDLEGNCIKHWSEINKLSKMSFLEHMMLEDTKIESILFQSDSALTSDFPNLNRLNISNNLIKEWRSISELSKLQKLEHLRFTNNPILETESPAMREQLVIAHLRHLKTFNGRTIIDEERRGAEYDYIKKYALEWIKVKDTPERGRFLLQHNRYLELIEKYGLPEESELIVQPNILKSSLIELNIEFEGRRISKKLPPSILIQKLVMLIQKLFKLKERPSIKYIGGSQSDIIIELDDEMKELGYYSIQEGDTIIVQI